MQLVHDDIFSRPNTRGYGYTYILSFKTNNSYSTTTILESTKAQKLLSSTLATSINDKDANGDST